MRTHDTHREKHDGREEAVWVTALASEATVHGRDQCQGAADGRVVERACPAVAGVGGEPGVQEVAEEQVDRGAEHRAPRVGGVDLGGE
jgi:hypothetical protein